jgi:hypothetical protein
MKVSLENKFKPFFLAAAIVLPLFFPGVVPVTSFADDSPTCWHLVPDNAVNPGRNKTVTPPDTLSYASNYNHPVDIQLTVTQVGNNVYSYSGQASSFIGKALDRREISYPIGGTGIVGASGVDLSLTGTGVDNKTADLVDIKIHIVISGLKKTYTQVIKNFGDNKEAILSGKAAYCQ